MKRNGNKPAHEKKVVPKQLATKVMPTGVTLNPAGAPPGKKLMTRIREMLGDLSKIRSKNKDGTPNYRFDDVANSFVEKMEEGSFIHTKEYIDREEGKVPTRHADADGKTLKLYVGMPVDDNDPEAP